MVTATVILSTLHTSPLFNVARLSRACAPAALPRVLDLSPRLASLEAAVWTCPVFDKQLLDSRPAEENAELLESVEGREVGSVQVVTVVVGAVDLETERIVQWGPWRWHKSGLV